ncbi:MAG TPA: FAD:protein FMN transferase [Candidatus Ozemobacteraceae bacterium]|nr:FAD:protein FMN transferase [Candidatus Ozemobacteraceae bacterium]HQG29115.1 FAD:protein FMN transferase [Candidatus Ozemobacteraceae bacterium]
MPDFRRLIPALLLGALLLGHAWLFPPQRQATDHFRFTQLAMGTIFHLDCYGVDEKTAARASQQAFARLHRIEASLSRFKGDSELSRLNASPETVLPVSEEFADCLRVSLEAGDATDGSFDISFLPLYEFWDWRGGRTSLPAPASVAETLEHIGYRKISFDPASRTVSLRKDMKLDLGGVAKGFAIGRMAAVLKEQGVADGIIEGGGDLVVTASRSYTIGIQDPFGPRGKPAARLIVTGPAAVFTSGDYEQYATIDGKSYSHIIDPRTGYPAEGPKSATIIGSDPAMTDALATALIAMGLARAQEFARERDLPVVLISSSGEFHFSPALASYARLIRD